MKFRIKYGSLSRRIIFTIIIFVGICLLGGFFALTTSMRNSIMEDAVNEEYAHIKEVEQSIANTTETTGFATEIVRQDASINAYLELLHNGEDYDINEKLDFYQKNLSALENMSNTNPYLYQIRLFVNSDIASEKAPTLFKLKRIDNLSWSENDINNRWALDLSDTIFPEEISTASNHLASQISPVRDSDGEIIYVIEAITYMNDLFPGIYEENNDSISGFFSCDDEKWYSSTDETYWKENEDKFYEFIDSKEDSQVRRVSIDGEKVILSSLWSQNLNGYYFSITSIEPIMRNYYRGLVPYIFALLGLFALFVIISKIAVDKIMGRFYEMNSVMTEIGQGNLDMRLSETGKDEITDLSVEINRMLSRIQKLNEDNLKRELLAKNAQIKSLQNQINAHFLYNVLESIKMMAEIEEQYEISDAITNLGNMLRYSMKWMDGTVKLRDEINYLNNYISLLNIRFDYEIYLSTAISEEFYDMEIPKMLLQPIIENSVYHGIEEMAEDTNIYVKSIRVDDMTSIIEITDAGAGMTKEELEKLREKINDKGSQDIDGHGIGLKNVQERIHLYYGNEYGITIDSQKDCYTKVSIHLPSPAKRRDESVN